MPPSFTAKFAKKGSNGVLAAIVAAAAVASSTPPQDSMLAPRRKLHSTPSAVFLRALQLVRVQSSDVLFDLGCGDGRCVVEAAKHFGIRAIGVEIDPNRAQLARQLVATSDLHSLVTIQCANALDIDLEQATIVFLFLIERGLRRLLPALQKRRKPCRVITYLYALPGIPFQQRHYLPMQPNETNGTQATDPYQVMFPVYFYTFPMPSDVHDQQQETTSESSNLHAVV